MIISDFVNKPIVSIIGSGKTTESLTPLEVKLLEAHTFVICLNYVTKVKPNMRLWRDVGVSQWLAKKETDYWLASRRYAFGNKYNILEELRPLYERINLWVPDVEECPWTAMCAIKQCQFIGKPVLLVGFDCLPDDKTSTAYNDVSGEVYKREHDGQANHLKELPELIKEQWRLGRMDNFINCSPVSTITGIPKMPIGQALPSLIASEFYSPDLLSAPKA